MPALSKVSRERMERRKRIIRQAEALCRVTS
jgi:hypothetical protein